ncbi:thioesterase family protein [Amycolatopsis acidiphila]|uniref:Acyl-CoA thioesterase II n=1 Tax=Amycolatopsis acidiphila TaxID=715473 RepID=A0A557ZZH6_9PSEU|nr:acyl-CoA thioesterase domain-containing protein [Amycolatopsis acidiphila]TVT17425.1 acyl-CoA thioesterase II [Amycolatopsis acidiphila]UIJ57270.1 thioesterase family protein [Amycolatopsis acidiphila]GHG52342.1 acyl-CoA thioesterase II [Amycolatopsis acidiphila]
MTAQDFATRPSIDLQELLELEVIERDLFRANAVFDDPYPLYGGQVAAQALLAAGATAPEGRLPHSLHGYYLRGGDASHPTVFRVDRDRDGRSYSARRVVAIQRGEVIFSMSTSFQVVEEGPDHQVEPMPAAGDPGALPSFLLPRLTSMEGRLPAQPAEGIEWPTRFWARCTLSLPDDPLLHAATLTYLSDISTGLAPLHDETHQSGATLDHAVWFHRPVRVDDWVLLDLVPHNVAGGRGWYTGSIHARGGVLGASLAQETLYRRR